MPHASADGERGVDATYGPPRRVAVLGSTGSIGRQALEVLAEPAATGVGGRALELVALSADSSHEQLLRQAWDHGGVRHALLHDPVASRQAQQEVDRIGSRLHLHETVGSLLDESQPDLVLNAAVGFAGLDITVAALERGIDVALANKESLVAGGAICRRLAVEHGASIVPVDSEHSALQQCIGASLPEEVESLVLTASGGPFRGRSRDELRDVTVEAALDHPTWQMGGKITVDSATLMNKGLELIEAMMLFDVAEHAVETVVHPDSVVHALVRHRDGSLLAHMGWPDMRVPIAWALHWPVRPRVDVARHYDLVEGPPLRFEQPDLETFRCLALARAAARAGGAAPCVLNAANEVAVEAFLHGELPFLAIPEVVEAALAQVASARAPESLHEAHALDEAARGAAARAMPAFT